MAAVIEETVDSLAVELAELSKQIWSRPELAMDEVFAHNTLSTFLEARGFTVERRYILDTAFRATFRQGEGGANVVSICEYDALPDIGHACGHNLISESGERVYYENLLVHVLVGHSTKRQIHGCCELFGL